MQARLGSFGHANVGATAEIREGPSQAPLVRGTQHRRPADLLGTGGAACVQGRTRCCVKKRRKSPQKREPLSGHSPRGYVLKSPSLSLSVILLLYIVDFSPCISPKFVVLGFSSNVMQSTVAPHHGCLAGSRCLFSCQNKARGTATKSLRHFQRRSLFRPCSCNCNDRHSHSKLSWTFSPCPALTKRRCLLLGPNWRSHVLLFFFCRHFHLYITESHILCAYYIKALVCFLSAKSVQKSVYKAQPIFSPYRVKHTRPPFVVLFLL